MNVVEQGQHGGTWYKIEQLPDGMFRAWVLHNTPILPYVPRKTSGPVRPGSTWGQWGVVDPSVSASIDDARAWAFDVIAAMEPIDVTPDGQRDRLPGGGGGGGGSRRSSGGGGSRPTPDDGAWLGFALLGGFALWAFAGARGFRW